MKKLLKSNKLIQKILISIIIVLLFTFAVPTNSQAVDFGGLLLKPLETLFGTLADIVPGALQAFLIDGDFNNANSDDNGFVNIFMVKHDKFNADTYPDFAYHTSSKEAQIIEKSSELDKDYLIPVLKYTPAKIFSGRVPALDINFVNPTDWETEGYAKGTEMNERSVAQQIHKTIAKWYVNLRNLAIVGLMLVLVYVGIRIVISSTAADKSKYKEMLKDWLVALCILFCLHYIMTFTTTLVSEVSGVLNGTKDQTATATEINGNDIAVTVEGDNVQFNTDIMGLIRFRMQYSSGGYKLLYLIFYIAMVIYTCMFTFYYLKRVITIAFLTIISPLVALTYPIDKIRDGKAQAFNLWIKEYVFNALLQPFHLIIYTIFVTMSVDLVAINPIFAIIALAFLTPAEKILRKFFGFDKASTAGVLGGFAGGATAIALAQKLIKPPKSGKASSSPKGNIRTRQTPEGDVASIGEALGGTGGNNQTPQTDTIRTTDSATNAQQTTFGGQGFSRQTSSGLYVPDSFETESATTQGTPSSLTTSQEPRPTNDASIYKPWKWAEDDIRGMGRYIGDIARYGASRAGDAFANTGLGQRAIRMGTAAKGTAHSLAENAGKIVRKVPKPLRNTARGVGNVALKTAKAAGTSTLKTAGRLAGRAAAAVPGAIFGMAAGIAGDDLGDIAKYTAAGAALTGTIGYSAAASALGSAGTFISDAYNEGAYGSDEALIAHAEQEYVKSKEWDDVYQHEFKHDDGSKLSRAELKEKKQQGSFYAARGITGEDAIKAVKLEDKIKKEIGPDNDNLDPQQYTARIMKIAKSYSADKLRKPGEVEGLTTSIQKELINGGFDSQSANREARTAVKYIKQAKGIKDE